MPFVTNKEQWEELKKGLENSYTEVVSNPAEYPCWAIINDFYQAACYGKDSYDIAFIYLDKHGYWDVERFEKEESWCDWPGAANET